MTPVLFNLLPCPKCGVESGQSCVNLVNGGPVSRSHVRRTPAAPCGTYGGAQRHRKAGEDCCAPCLDAHRRYMAAYRKTHPAYRENDIGKLRDRREATRILVSRHRDEFNELLAEVGR